MITTLPAADFFRGFAHELSHVVLFSMGRLPRGIGVTSLRHRPSEWSRQYSHLGLAIPALDGSF
jgi:hypothetical protein